MSSFVFVGGLWPSLPSVVSLMEIMGDSVELVGEQIGPIAREADGW